MNVSDSLFVAICISLLFSATSSLQNFRLLSWCFISNLLIFRFNALLSWRYYWRHAASTLVQSTLANLAFTQRRLASILRVTPHNYFLYYCLDTKMLLEYFLKTFYFLCSSCLAFSMRPTNLSTAFIPASSIFFVLHLLC